MVYVINIHCTNANANLNIAFFEADIAFLNLFNKYTQNFWNYLNRNAKNKHYVAKKALFMVFAACRECDCLKTIHTTLSVFCLTKQRNCSNL